MFSKEKLSRKLKGFPKGTEMFLSNSNYGSVMERDFLQNRIGCKRIDFLHFRHNLRGGNFHENYCLHRQIYTGTRGE